MSVLNDVLFEVLDKLSSSILIVDSEFEPTYCNLAFLHLIESPKDEFDLDLASIFPKLNTKLLEQKDFTTRLKPKNKRSFVVEVKVDDLEKNLKLLRIRKFSVGNETFHSSRLETLGMLAGSVAHDFNNILAGILGHVEFLKGKITDVKAQNSLSSIQEGGLKAAQITREILQFSKRSEGNSQQEVDVNDVAQRTVTLLHGSLKPNSIVEIESSEQHLFISGSEVKLSQILVNLLVNAHDAIQEAEGCSKLINLKISKAGESVSIEVKDEGCGMTAEVQEQVFKPYFSTKAQRGTGLGLTTVAAIVRDLDGEVEIKSKQGQGTTIIVLLPMVEKSTEDCIVQETSKLKKIDPSKNILIIDDEEVILSVLELNLEQLGYSVTLCDSSVKALELFKQNPEKYELVILDMLMPEVSGEEAFRQIREVKPKQKVLIVSGFCSDDTIDELTSYPACKFLAKPFTMEELSKLVNEFFS